MSTTLILNSRHITMQLNQIPVMCGFVWRGKACMRIADPPNHPNKGTVAFIELSSGTYYTCIECDVIPVNLKIEVNDNLTEVLDQTRQIKQTR